jgi:5-hydroxyisourate hydrolase
MSQITTHILDTSKGKPASGVKVFLYRQHDEDWREIGSGITNADGRIDDLLLTFLSDGVCKIKFETKAYFEAISLESFYPFVEIIFEVFAGQHYHLPLLLSPYGFSTYRGS